MKIKFVRWIRNVGYPTNDKKYQKAHRAANKKEKNVFGLNKYKKLNDVINKYIPSKELAGTHKNGVIEVSKRIQPTPKWMRREIITHEKLESKLMGR